MNSGDPIGAGIFPSSYGNGYRTTSATAHLPNRPHNLTIWTNSSVGRVLFKGKKAIGIECVDGVRRKSPLFRAPNGRQTDRLLIAALCSKEVILCAGAFDSPKILLLSGIGPGAELASHDIDIVHDLPGVGKNLQDHPCVFLTTEVDPILSEIHAFESDTEGLLRARQEWLATGTGPLTHHNGTIFGAFLKLPHLQNSAEFKALDPSTRAQLLSPTVPHYEIANGSVLVPPGFPVANDSGYMTPIAILMNPQSRGHVTLRSADPADAALIDLKLLDHPYDRKVMVDLIRETVLFQQQSAVGKYFRRHILGPKSLSNEDIVVSLLPPPPNPNPSIHSSIFLSTHTSLSHTLSLSRVASQLTIRLRLGIHQQNSGAAVARERDGEDGHAGRQRGVCRQLLPRQRHRWAPRRRLECRALDGQVSFSGIQKRFFLLFFWRTVALMFVFIGDSNHPQSTAYLIGLKAAEALIKRWEL